ncbi:phage tail length tape-measure protein [Bacillus sp. JCM 19045]|nr:phage tail length tape-measure protein [Bacillus sp. JCM 19045]
MDAVGHLIVGTSDTLAQQIESADFGSIGGAIPEGLADGIGAGIPRAEDASEQMANDTIIAAEQAFDINSPSKVFRGIGEYVVDGLVEGIESGSGKVAQAMQNMLNAVLQSTQQTLSQMTNSFSIGVSGIQSELMKLIPITQNVMNQNTKIIQSGAKQQVMVMQQLVNQKVQAFSKTPQQLRMIAQQSMQFMQIAYQLGMNQQFLVVRNGVQQQLQSIRPLPQNMRQIAQMTMRNMLSAYQSGVSQQINLMNRTARDKVNAFRSTPSQLRSVGQNAMAGLNQGLLNGRGRVMSTARSIANDVARTMQSALKIKSPSRVMRDDVGRWVPEGLAEGIKANSSSVFREIDNLSKGMIKYSRPEAALNVSTMTNDIPSYLVDSRGASNQSNNSQSTNQADSAKQPVVINLMVNGKKMATELFDDFSKLQNRKNQRTKRNKGGLT